MKDELTKYQRYNLKHPVYAFRGDEEMGNILDRIAEKENISRQKLLYNMVKKYLREYNGVKIKYELEE